MSASYRLWVWSLGKVLLGLCIGKESTFIPGCPPTVVEQCYLFWLGFSLLHSLFVFSYGRRFTNLWCFSLAMQYFHGGGTRLYTALPFPTLLFMLSPSFHVCDGADEPILGLYPEGVRYSTSRKEEGQTQKWVSGIS